MNLTTLTTQSYLSIFDNLNENSKNEIISELFSRMSLSGIQNDPIFIQKYKDHIFQTPLVPQIKRLIELSNDPFFLNLCCQPRFLRKLNLRWLVIQNWKFYYMYEGNMHITSEHVYLGYPSEKQVFNILDITDASIDKLYVDEYEMFEGRLVISGSPKWYEALHIYKYNRF